MKKRNSTETLGQRLNAIITEKGLSTTQVAQRSGISLISLNEWCNDAKVPSQADLPKLAKGLGLKIAKLKRDLCK